MEAREGQQMGEDVNELVNVAPLCAIRRTFFIGICVQNGSYYGESHYRRPQLTIPLSTTSWSSVTIRITLGRDELTLFVARTEENHSSTKIITRDILTCTPKINTHARFLH